MDDWMAARRTQGLRSARCVLLGCTPTRQVTSCGRFMCPSSAVHVYFAGVDLSKKQCKKTLRIYVTRIVRGFSKGSRRITVKSSCQYVLELLMRSEISQVPASAGSVAWGGTLLLFGLDPIR